LGQLKCLESAGEALSQLRLLKYHCLHGSNSRTLSLTLGGYEVQHQRAQEFGYPVREPLLGLQVATFSLYPHVTEGSGLSSFYNEANPITGAIAL
jgi:hypothetical protein